MGIIKRDDVIAWREDDKTVCEECVEDIKTAAPLTRNDIDEMDIVTCDSCGERIQ